jgi:O-antigen/teichoic acid export membrane protein
MLLQQAILSKLLENCSLIKIKQNPLLKVMSLNSISVVVSFVLGLFSIRIISLFLGTSGMALLGSFRNFTTMLRSLATLGINNSVVKLVVENKHDKEALSEVYTTFFWLFLMLSILLASLVLIFAGPISAFLFFENSYTYVIRLFALVLPLVIINTFWVAIYNGLEEFNKIIIIQILSNIFIFLITAFLIWKKQLLGGLLSVAFGEVISVLITFLYVRKNVVFFRFNIHKVIHEKHFDVIRKFSGMALLTAVLTPLTIMLIRDFIVKEYSVNEAGIWDASSRISVFYMMLFNSGLSLYYMPKLASLQTDDEFRVELKSYFRIFVPLILIAFVSVFFLKDFILNIAFTNAFSKVKELLIWQLLGDFFKILTLAFGFQIVVKTMVRRYFIIAIVFNLSYLLLSYYLVTNIGIEGALQAYFYANLITFFVIIGMFRKVILNAS